MSSQQGPPVRPWFRLASMARPAPTPAPAPAQGPTPEQPARPPSVRPTFTFRPPPSQSQPLQPPPPPAAAVPPPTAPTSSVPTSPVFRNSLSTSPAPRSSATALSSPPSSSLPPSAPQPPASAVTTTTNARTLTPKSPPKVVNTPPPSPKLAVSGPSLLQTSSQPTPPRSPAPANPLISTITTRSETPKSSPKNVKQVERTPNPSPKGRSIFHPPSPLTLPPAQIKTDLQPEAKIPVETEKKTVVVHESIQKLVNHSSSSAQNGLKSEEKHNSEAKKKGNNHKKSSHSEEFGMSVITIAGENKGAVMEISPSRNKHGFWGKPKTLQKNGNPAAWSDDEKSGSEYDEEGRPNLKNKNPETEMKPHWTKYMNSNVQGVNNSIVFNSSSTHHDPGVHLSFSRKINTGNGHGTHRKE